MVAPWTLMSCKTSSNYACPYWPQQPARELYSRLGGSGIRPCDIIMKSEWTHIYIQITIFEHESPWVTLWLFINALQLWFSGATDLTCVKGWEIHPKMDRLVWHYFASQIHWGLLGTEIASRFTRKSEQHRMAEGATLLHIRRSQIGHDVKHLFKAIPIRWPDESSQCRHSGFNGWCWALPPESKMRLLDIKDCALIAHQQGLSKNGNARPQTICKEIHDHPMFMVEKSKEAWIKPPPRSNLN